MLRDVTLIVKKSRNVTKIIGTPHLANYPYDWDNLESISVLIKETSKMAKISIIVEIWKLRQSLENVLRGLVNDQNWQNQQIQQMLIIFEEQ